MIKKIVLGLIGLVLILAVVGGLLPRVAHVQRSIDINRPASLVFATVNTFEGSSRWSPWADYDPDMKVLIEGPREGVGAKMSWSGNEKVGQGSQVISASVENQLVRTDLDFGDTGTGKAAFTMAPAGAGTRLTWSLDSDMGAGPVGRYLGLMMDHWIGPDYENGLRRIKALVEAMPNVDIASLEVEPVELSAKTVAVVAKTTPVDAIAISNAYTEAYQQIGEFLKKNKLQASGPALGIDTSMAATSYSFKAGIPVDAGALQPAGGVQFEQSYGGKALKTTYVGPYDGLGKASERFGVYAHAHAFESNGETFAWYLDDPATTPAEQLRTEMNWPIK